MPNQNTSPDLRPICRIGRVGFARPFAVIALFLATGAVAHAQAPLRERLEGAPFQIAYECHVNDNWEIFVMNGDGSQPVNLTRTPKEHEHYPQVSSRIGLAHRGALAPAHPGQDQ